MEQSKFQLSGLPMQTMDTKLAMAAVNGFLEAYKSKQPDSTFEIVVDENETRYLCNEAVIAWIQTLPDTSDLNNGHPVVIDELPDHSEDPTFKAHVAAVDTTTQVLEEVLTQRDILAKALKVIASPSRVESDSHARLVATTALGEAKIT